MPFITALLHASIGYGIRRSLWPHHCLLTLTDTHCLLWTEDSNYPNVECKLLGPNPSKDLTDEDIRATDWEVV